MIAAAFVLLVVAAPAGAQSPSVPSTIGRQSQDDAWWTGPMLAPSAATLPAGHFLIEPYFFNVAVKGRYDQDGVRHSATRVNGFGSLTYVLYGIGHKMTVGLIPIIGYTTVTDGLGSSGIGLGDLTLQAQYGLVRSPAGRSLPTVSIAVQETLPTGKYDRLGDRPADGLGSGAYTTTLALYSQTYFWLPNGRILRMRINALRAFSRSAKVEGVSVYGTGTGFRGHARPGHSLFVDAAWEYSVTRRWVLALDATYRHDANTRVTGSDARDSGTRTAVSVEMDSGSSDAFGLAPAIEYNWTRNLGVLIGVRLIPAGRNTAATITPAIAINFVH